MKSDMEKKKELSDFLTLEYIKTQYREGKTISQTGWARRIGIPQSSFSHYVTGTRIPDDDNAHVLAAHFGTVIYDILEMPMMLPNDPNLRAIAKVWGKLTPDLRKKFANLIEDEALAWEERSIPKSQGNPIAAG